MRVAPKKPVYLAFAVALCCLVDARAQGDMAADPAAPYSFAVFGSPVSEGERATRALLRAIDGSPSRFVVHFDVSPPSAASCADTTLARRRELLDASARPAIPVTGSSEWADCGKAASDPLERLERVGDALFGSDESLGQTRLQWLRQSAVPRFHRYRENLRWQVGKVLFATINLPDNNNNFRLAAGRNGEFEERAIANHAWLERTFRLATERRLSGIVIFIDAAPHFGAALRVPDGRSRERDGFYEWKLAFRDFVPAFKGQVLLVQARYAPDGRRPTDADRPLLDSGGHVIENFARIGLAESADLRWLRVDVDPANAKLFRIATERVFDDPSGELYGVAK